MEFNLNYSRKGFPGVVYRIFSNIWVNNMVDDIPHVASLYARVSTAMVLTGKDKRVPPVTRFTNMV